MKSIRSVGKLLLPLTFALIASTALAATTATPSITSVTGNTSGFINLAGSTTVAVVTSITGSSTASTTITVSLTDTSNATSTATTSAGGASGQPTPANTTVNASSLLDGAITVTVVAKAGGDATSSIATTSVTKDTVNPSITVAIMFSNNSSSTIAKVGNTITLQASSSETIGAPTVTIFGYPASVTGSVRSWAATITSSSTNATGTVAFSINSGFSDNAGNTGSATTTSLTSGAGVFMYQPPVITILGSNPVSINVGASYTDAGATALDSRNNNITSNIFTTNNLNNLVTGAYTYTYTASDAAGSATTTATRTVNVAGTIHHARIGGSTFGNTGTTSTTTVETVSTSSLFMVTPSGNVIELPITPGTLNAQAVHNAIIIKRQLKFGLRGDDISQVQGLLAQDKDIYPEGLVTGFFGRLTEKAVQKFQEKYGIAKKGNGGYGQIGPRTKAKLIELFGI